MLRYVLFDLSLFEPGADTRRAREDLLWMLEALTERDQAYLRDHPGTPTLYQSGVVYERPQQFGGDCDEVTTIRAALGSKANNPAVKTALESVQAAMGGERFRDIGRIIERGRGDCDNVASWRAAELRQQGIKADPYITWRRRLDGGYTYHVQVRWPDGTIEDPSLLLGMGGADRAADRQKEIEKNQDRVNKALAASGRIPVNKPTDPLLAMFSAPTTSEDFDQAISDFVDDTRNDRW